MTIRYVAIAVAFIAISCHLYGQNATTRGKEQLTEGLRFMVAFPQVWATSSEKPAQQPMLLLISSKTKTTARVRTPSSLSDVAKIDAEYVIEANKVRRVPISTALPSGTYTIRVRCNERQASTRIIVTR